MARARCSTRAWVLECKSARSRNNQVAFGGFNVAVEILRDPEIKAVIANAVKVAK
jgi:hypothetical protein